MADIHVRRICWLLSFGAVMLTAACAERTAAHAGGSVRSLALIPDSVFDDGYSGSIQVIRTTDGQLVAGPLRGPYMLKTLSPDLRSAVGFVRKGAGPNEVKGHLTLSAAPSNRLLIADNRLLRAKLFDMDGTVTRALPYALLPDGTAFCGPRLLASGVRPKDARIEQGIFALDSTGADVLVHAMPQGDRFRNSVGSSQLMAVRLDRVVVANPNVAEIAVSDSGCRSFRRVAFSLPWLVPKPKGSAPSYPFQAPMEPRITGVRWANDRVITILALRARADANYQRGSGSSGLPPMQGEPWHEFVLVWVDVLTGQSLGEQVFSGGLWSFVSDRELMKIGDDEPGLRLFEIAPPAIAERGAARE